MPNFRALSHISLAPAILAPETLSKSPEARPAGLVSACLAEESGGFSGRLNWPGPQSPVLGGCPYI
jgi:hypothetical protein